MKTNNFLIYFYATLYIFTQGSKVNGMPPSLKNFSIQFLNKLETIYIKYYIFCILSDMMYGVIFMYKLIIIIISSII